MVKSALIIVDMQNDFLTGSLSLSNCPAQQNGEEIVEVINSLAKLPDWDLIVFTQDWHPHDHLSFITNISQYEQHEDSQINFESAEVYDIVHFKVDGNKQEQVLWPPHCRQGTWGAEFHKDLYIPENSEVVKKGTRTFMDSYSAFFDNGHLHQTELEDLLRSREIDQNFICGVATDVCVSFTLTDSHELGFKTFMLEDACRGVSDDGIKEAKNKMNALGIQIITTDQVEGILKSSTSNTEVLTNEDTQIEITRL